MSKRITICPKRLQCDAVGTTTSPVTQVLVVAVNNASIKEVGAPLFVLIGSDSRVAPTSIAAKKLSIIMCVEERNFLFFIIKTTLFYIDSGVSILSIESTFLIVLRTHTQRKILACISASSSTITLCAL